MKSLRERCSVNTNEDGDRFVGVKADSDDAIIYFPIGYQLPDNDDELRADIHNLFGVLAEFMKVDKIIEKANFEEPHKVDFPIHAYLTVIRDFLQKSRYIIETDPRYLTDTRGRTSWSRTVREQRGLLQRNGSLVFTKLTVRSTTPNENKEITQIHKYCVFEAFNKLGWLYVSFMPEKPETIIGIKESIYILEKRLAATNNDVKQELFRAMKAILEYVDKTNEDAEYFFGTEDFDHIWEKMIDKAFGIEDKEKYFPRTRWLLDYGLDKEKRPLYPDTIMIYKNKYYVLDAKCYRYGCTGNPNNLPNGTDINKQITYGEYIERAKGVGDKNLFNCFIMPYNMKDNPFHFDSPVGNVGEAIGDWRYNPDEPRMKNYERIQGIVMDTRYLMYNYIGTSEQQKKVLAKCIEKVLLRESVSSRI